MMNKNIKILPKDRLLLFVCFMALYYYAKRIVTSK